jgi:septum formation protein
MKKQTQLYLASTSPRRTELLHQIGMDFSQLIPAIDEQQQPNEVPEMYVLRLALHKARAGLAKLADGDPRPVLGADTVVVFDHQILGKPRDEADACAMLSQLAGQTHRVMTAVAMVDASGEEHSRLSVSQVRLRAIGEDEIRHYWHSGEPVDKAGGYAIQGLGALFIEHLEGSYSGVMGLPLFETAELLALFGIQPLLE